MTKSNVSKDPVSHFLIDEHPTTWLEPWQELWRERSAIIEFEAKVPREEAEKKAAALIRHDFKRAVAERNW